jgi:glycosyltransferase involved in cell wall biosynthesis
MNKNNLPQVSVVMSVYNAGSYLQEAIDSILNQTFSNFEFIIVNDGSTDDSLSVIKSYNDNRIVLLDQVNSGLSKALNDGIACANSKYIARMDADDIALPDRLELQYNIMESNADIAVLGSNAQVIDSKGYVLYNTKMILDDIDLKNFFPNSPFIHPTVIFRKEYFDSSGGYNEDIKQYFEDVVLWKKMAKYGKFENIANPLIQYRITPNALTNSTVKDRKFLKLKSKIIDRGFILEKEIPVLHRATQLSFEDKEVTYYIHLGKKYLINSRDVQKARESFITAYNKRFSVKGLLFIFLTFLPQKALIKLHEIIK